MADTNYVRPASGDIVLMNFPYMGITPPSPLTRWKNLAGEDMIGDIDQYNDSVERKEVQEPQPFVGAIMRLNDVYPGIEDVAGIPEPI